MKKRILLISLALFAVVTLSAQDKIRVACVGDSITAGSGSGNSATSSYPAVLSILMGEEYEVKNFGISGRTLLNNGDRPYTNERIYRESLEFQPDIVVIKLGTNDSKPQNWDSHSGEFEGDLTALVNSYKNLDSKPRVYLCLPVKIWQNKFRIRDEVATKEIIPIIKKVAKKTKSKLIDLNSTLADMPQLVPDGVHPNAMGYVLVAKEVRDAIIK